MNKLLIYVGSFIVGTMVLVAVFAKTLAPFDPGEMSLMHQFEAPSWAHYFGRDQNGCDVFSRVVVGARISLLVSFSGVFVSASVGLAVGSITGYLGGWIDNVLMRFLDIFLAFPGFLLNP